MDRELKIVVSVFLIFFIYAISSFFNQGVFLAPIILSRFTIVIVAFLLLLINLRQKNAYILALYLVATVFLTLTDSFSIGYLGQKFDTEFFIHLSNSLTFLLVSFFFYFGFLFFCVIHYYQITKKRILTFYLCVLLVSLLALFLTDYYLIKEILIHLFFVSYFVIIQYNRNIKDNIIQIISYQYLLVFLLESFEYFV